MEIKDKEFYDRMKDLLLRIPHSKVGSGGREIIMPCRYCDDKGSHMYVSLPVDGNIMLHNCYRASCGASGVVTHNSILEWGLYDLSDDLEHISRYNKIIRNNSKNIKHHKNNTFKLNNNYITDDALSQAKLGYINKRLGINLTYDDILNLKIVLNLKDLLDSNKISKNTRSDFIINELNESFLGFISKDNSFVNMKNLRLGKVHKNVDMRYVNYNIFDNLENVQRYYVIPTNIDLLDPRPVKLNIAEGPFDILSIYYNIRKQEAHSIYAAILGGSYYNTIKYFIYYLKIPNLEIHIYLDGDFYNSKKYNNLIYQLQDIKRVYSFNVYMHINTCEGEKDFGVGLNKVIEHVFKI